MLINGAELAAFMRDGWPGAGTPQENDWYWDHDLFDDIPEPEVKYDTYDLGDIKYHGNGEDPTGGEGYDLAALIRKWRKTRTHDHFPVSIPKDQVAGFKAYLKSIKGSITT
jgi:hypothetical protein